MCVCVCVTGLEESVEHRVSSLAAKVSSGLSTELDGRFTGVFEHIDMQVRVCVCVCARSYLSLRVRVYARACVCVYARACVSTHLRLTYAMM